MKILFTGGGTGGHFYPIIAVVQSLYEKAKERNILTPQMYYMAPTQYNPRILFDNDIQFVPVPAGKIRRYFSLLNVTDMFKTAIGILTAVIKLYRIYPDVVFGTGGYVSFPALFAARLLRIPVIIHESDTSPGRVNAWAAKFAERIALSYPDAASSFTMVKDKSRIAFTGNPIRKEILQPLTNGAHEFLNLEEKTPVILIMGGSQGAQNVNDIVIDALPELTKRYQVLHQTGKKNFDTVKEMAKITLKDNEFAYRYHPFDYLNDLALRMTAGVTSVIVSRGGSTIFEIATWGLPSIIIPLSKKISHDQVNNALAYSRIGACTVIEEENFSANILVSEIDRIVNNQHIADAMRENAQQWSHTDAASKIADVILEIALKHE